MQVGVSWYREGYLIYIDIPAEFDIAEWQQANLQITDMIRRGTPPVHVIIDMLANQKHPVNPKEIIGATTWLKEPQIGWTVHMTKNRLVKMLGMITIQAFTARYRQVVTLEEALAFLAEIDHRL